MTLITSRMITIILLLTAITTALIAGLFYAWCCSVTPGLGRLNDAEYLSAMQSLNEAILNPLFFASFAGTLFLLPASTLLHYGGPLPERFRLLLAATVLYIVGVWGVTIVGNIPLNNALGQFNIKTASAEDLAMHRRAFEYSWNRFNTTRTLAAVITLVMVLIACICPSKQ